MSLVRGRSRIYLMIKNCSNDCSILHYPMPTIFSLIIIINISYTTLLQLAVLDGSYYSNPYDLTPILNQIHLEMPLFLHPHQIGDEYILECQLKLYTHPSLHIPITMSFGKLHFLPLSPIHSLYKFPSSPAPGTNSSKPGFVTLVPIL